MTYPRIIGLNGVARAGKDTVAKILHDLYGYEVFSYSETLNDALIALNPIIGFSKDEDRIAPVQYSRLIEELGYETAKDEIPEVRRLLQAMGTEVGRNLLGENIWVDALFKKIGPSTKAVITNVRFPNEANAVWQRDGDVWEVIRPGYKPANDHISDTALDGIRKNARIVNDGSIPYLADKVMNVMEWKRYSDGGVSRAHNEGIRAGS